MRCQHRRRLNITRLLAAVRPQIPALAIELSSNYFKIPKTGDFRQLLAVMFFCIENIPVSNKMKAFSILGICLSTLTWASDVYQKSDPTENCL